MYYLLFPLYICQKSACTIRIENKLLNLLRQHFLGSPKSIGRKSALVQPIANSNLQDFLDKASEIQNSCSVFIPYWIYALNTKSNLIVIPTKVVFELQLAQWEQHHNNFLDPNHGSDIFTILWKPLIYDHVSQYFLVLLKLFRMLEQNGIMSKSTNVYCNL